jgi:phage gp46-like protein
MTVAVEPVDIKIAQNADGIYDISFDENGDFVLDRSYETGIRMSLFLDSRADESEVKQDELRRGWFGNFELYNVLHEIGSKLWLLEQERNTVKVRNYARGYVTDSLQWLIDEKHAKKIEVETSSTNLYELVLTVTITYPADISQSFRFNLWSNTKEF